MLKKMEIGEHTDQRAQKELIEEMETALQTLRELRERVAELKRKCQEFRQIESENVESEHFQNKLRCDKCGYMLYQDQAVIVKDSHGAERSRYHKECFRTLFK